MCAIFVAKTFRVCLLYKNELTHIHCRESLTTIYGFHLDTLKEKCDVKIMTKFSPVM